MGWPVAHPSPADDVFERHGAPVAGVVAVRAIVAHHEERVGRHFEGIHFIVVIKAGVGFVKLIAVDESVSISDFDRIAGQADHALYEVPRGIVREVEDDDFSVLRRMEGVYAPILSE